MRYTCVAALAAALTIGLAAAPVAAQETDAGWTPARTPWGHPDLQGVWDQTTGTPLERAADAGGREFLTEEEAAERERRRFAAFDAAPRQGNPGNYGSQWRDGSRNALTRTSLIVDPPDGRIPALTPAAERRAARIRPAGATIPPTPGPTATCGSAASPAAPPGPQQLQQQHPAPPDARLGGAAERDDQRDPRGQPRRAPPRRLRRPPVERRLPRPLGGRHARRRDHQLQRQAGVPRSPRRQPAPRRAVHPHRAGAGSTTR